MTSLVSLGFVDVGGGDGNLDYSEGACAIELMEGVLDRALHEVSRNRGGDFPSYLPICLST